MGRMTGRLSFLPLARSIQAKEFNCRWVLNEFATPTPWQGQRNRAIRSSLLWQVSRAMNPEELGYLLAVKIFDLEPRLIRYRGARIVYFLNNFKKDQPGYNEKLMKAMIEKIMEIRTLDGKGAVRGEVLGYASSLLGAFYPGFIELFLTRVLISIADPAKQASLLQSVALRMFPDSLVKQAEYVGAIIGRAFPAENARKEILNKRLSRSLAEIC